MKVLPINDLVLVSEIAARLGATPETFEHVLAEIDAAADQLQIYGTRIAGRVLVDVMSADRIIRFVEDARARAGAERN